MLTRVQLEIIRRSKDSIKKLRDALKKEEALEALKIKSESPFNESVEAQIYVDSLFSLMYIGIALGAVLYFIFLGV